jgi:hypothetical protein
LGKLGIIIIFSKIFFLESFSSKKFDNKALTHVFPLLGYEAIHMIIRKLYDYYFLKDIINF